MVLNTPTLSYPEQIHQTALKSTSNICICVAADLSVWNVHPVFILYSTGCIFLCYIYVCVSILHRCKKHLHQRTLSQWCIVVWAHPNNLTSSLVIDLSCVCMLRISIVPLILRLLLLFCLRAMFCVSCYYWSILVSWLDAHCLLKQIIIFITLKTSYLKSAFQHLNIPQLHSSTISYCWNKCICHCTESILIHMQNKPVQRLQKKFVKPYNALWWRTYSSIFTFSV